MASIYQLKAQDNGVSALERDIRSFLRNHDATLVTRIEVGSSFTEVQETRNRGAYLYIQHQNGNVIPIYQDGRLRDHCAAQLNLVGFDEQSDYFRNLTGDLDTALAKYFIK